MQVFRRLLTVALAAALVLVHALGAGASTADDLDAARQRLQEARDAANTTAAAFSESDHKLEQLESEIANLQTTIATTKARAAELHDIARRRAVYAYKHSNDSLNSVIDAQGPVDAIRRTQLLNLANQSDNDVVRKLAVVNDQLKTQQASLEHDQTSQQTVTDQLHTKLESLQAKQADVEQAVAGLQSKLDAEIAAAAAAADAARRAQLEQERATLAAQQTVSNGGAGQIVASPIPGSFQCPVSGAAFSDDYGGPTGHPGIDMFVPIGTNAVAVKGGSVTYVANEGAGGNTAYLAANDGNVYFYAHLSQFVGQARTVSQGEIIGLTGMTGNATAPHLHFEIRLGGANGNRTNPYPTLKSAGC